MLKSLNTLLSDVNAQPCHKRWIKYYKKSFSINKDFQNTLPSLVKYAPILNFKEIDSSNLKKCILNFKSNSDISFETELAKFLKIDITPIPNNIDELCREAVKVQITKSTEKNLILVFDCITRYLICFSYQFNANFSANNLSLTHLQNFVDYYLKYRKHQKFIEDILILFNSFSNYLQILFDQIIPQSGSNDQQKIEFIQILHFLIPISKAFIEEGKDHYLLNFIITSFNFIFKSFVPKKFPPTILKTIIDTFSSIIELMPIADVKESNLLSSLSSHILSTIPNFSQLDNIQKYELGSLCLKIYGYPELTIPEESANQQFDLIISYVLWIVFAFGEKRTISEDYEEMMNEKSLQPIGISEYLKNVQLIPEHEPLITNQYLTQSAEMLNQMIQQSKYKTILISLLVEAMDKNQQRMKIEQYQSFAAFVLFVIHNCSEKSLASGFSNYWNLLLSDALFPEKNGLDDRSLRDAVLTIFLRCFTSVPSSRSAILSAISEYFNKHSINELRYFLPLLNNLLSSDSDVKFVHELIKSPLMSLLLNESKKYIDIFDLIRHIMFLNSRSCFESRTIIKYCFDCINIPLYRESMIRCLENTLITCTKQDDAQHVVSSLICEISSLIQSSLKTDLELAKQFVIILANSMKTFKEETIMTLFITYTFEILSQAVLQINEIDLFELVLSAFIELCQKYSQVLQYFLSRECHVYTYLTKYLKKINFDEKECEILFKFAFLNSNYQIIQNYHAVPLILECAKNKDIECQIYQRFYEICKKSSANVYELVKADIFTFILERINEVGYNKCTNNLFNIYARIASIFLPNSAYFDTLKLICLPQTDNPEKFISLFNSFLEQINNGPYYYCNSFFHLEKSSDGIFGPSNMHFGSKFSFVTMIRCECLNSKSPISLLSMVSDKNDLLEFTIVNSQIVMKRKSSCTNSNSDCNNSNNPNNSTTTTFSLKLKKNNFKNDKNDSVVIEYWNRIIIIVENFQVTVFIDDEKESTKNQLTPFQSTSFTVTIGHGFIGDFSEIYFLNEINIEKINDNISNKSIICQYIPRNVTEDIIQYVCKKPVKFNGQSVLYVNTILDVIKNESAIMNLLPLFSRFSICNECKVRNSSKRCKVCGSLDIDEGFDFIEKLFNYITMASSENAVFMINKHFFSILSNYFEEMNSCYFTARFFNLLLSFFKLIRNKELAQEMIESIFQNHDLLMKFSEEQMLEYFSEIFPKAYSIQKDVFHNYHHFKFLIFIAIAHFSEESEISKNIWKNILTILPNRKDYTSYSTILSIPMFHNYNFSSEIIFNCFEEMIDNQNIYFLKALESMEYFTPFTYIFQFPQIKLQVQAFRIVSKLKKKCEKSDIIRAVYQIIEYYSPTDDSIQLLKFANSVFLDEDGMIVNPDYFPLIVFISSYIDNEQAFPIFEQIMNSIYDFPVNAMQITIEVFNWTFWIIRYIIQFYPELNENTLSKFSLPFATLIETQILSLKLQYQEIFVQIITVCNQYKLDSRRILKDIIFYFFTQGSDSLSLSGPDLLKDAFIFTFFNVDDNDYTTKSIKISTPMTINSSMNRFCLFHDQYVIDSHFKIKTENDEGLVWIDQQFSEAIVSKISLLSDLSINISNVEYDGLLLVCYILVILMRFKSQIAIEIINENLVDELEKAEQEIAHKCTSFILRTRDCMLFESDNKEEIEKYLNNIKFDQLEIFTTFFNDKEDSYAFQLFLFENSLFKNTKEINESITKQQTNYITESNNFISFVLNIDFNTLDNESNEKNYFSSSTVSYTNLMVIYADLLNRQDFYITNAKYYRKQIADCFLKELFVLTNVNSQVNIHFKALNNISRKGRRVLMSIDYNKLSYNNKLTKKQRRSRLSSVSIYSSIKIDGTFFRHNQIDMSKISDSTQINPNPNSNANLNQIPSKHSKHNKQSENTVFRDMVSLLTPRRLYNGELVIIGKQLTFDGTDSVRSKHVEFNLDKILFIMKRTYGRFQKAVEVFTDFNRSFYFIFACSYSNTDISPKAKSKSHVNFGSQRHNFNLHVSSNRTVNTSKNNDMTKYDFFKELTTFYGSIYQKKKKGNPKLHEVVSKLSITKRWTNREMSNYEYLYYLNLLSGRSFNDISKYPVFPIVLMSKPNLQASQNVDEPYRNLGHPVGALNPEKLKKLLNSFRSPEDMKNQYFYTSMFSNPMIVASLLSKVEPFTSIWREIEHRKAINIDLPKFANKNESLNDGSVPENDDYELTPEFFTFPAIFGEQEEIQNQEEDDDQKEPGNNQEILLEEEEDPEEFENKLLQQQQQQQQQQLQQQQQQQQQQQSKNDQQAQNDSQSLYSPESLSFWFEPSYEFININRRALESDTVRSNLNKWIDLVFGCNRCSSSNVNVFHPLLYPENCNDSLTQAESDQQANETGLYPCQLFVRNHPSSTPLNLPPLDQYIGSNEPQNPCYVIKHISKKPALRIRKNFLITDDLKVTKFTFSEPSSKNLKRTQTTINQNEASTTASKSKGQRIAPKKRLSLSTSPLAESSSLKREDQVENSILTQLPPASSNVTSKKRIQLQFELTPPSHITEDLVQTATYAIPDVSDSLAPDILEVSRSLNLVVFASAGDSFISVCDLCKCKDDHESNSSSSNADTATPASVPPGGKYRSFSDLDERRLLPPHSGLAVDEVAFSSLKNGEKKANRREDSEDTSALLVPADVSSSNSTSTMTPTSSSSALPLLTSKLSSSTSSMISMRASSADDSSPIRIIRFENAAVQCACVSGGSVLAVGLSDGSVRVFRLPSLVFVRSSSYHNRPIVSVAANRDVGLLVSIDALGVVVFEFLFEARFVRSIKLDKVIKNDDFTCDVIPLKTSFVTIFKSGSVVVIVNRNDCNCSCVVFFSPQGDARKCITVDGVVREFDKFYDFDSREILILAVEPRKMVIVDVASEKVLSSSSGSFGQLRFCAVKNMRTIIYSNGRITQTLPLSMTQKANL